VIARQLSFFAPAAVMSAWATVMLHSIASGHIKQLLSPLFRNYVLVAAILLIVLSALYLFLYEPAAENQVPALAPTSRLRQLGRWLVLLLPIVGASILSPSSLSGSTMQNRQLDSTAGAIQMPTWNSTSQANAKAAIDSDPNQAVPVEVTDLITISQHPEQIKAFDGRKVHVVGQFSKQGGTKLVRWIMWCCAADAQPWSVSLDGNSTGDWKDQQWLEVTGTAQFPSTLGHIVPQIVVDSVKPTQEPDEPFLSP
jgi:putative membrane protein